MKKIIVAGILFCLSTNTDAQKSDTSLKRKIPAEQKNARNKAKTNGKNHTEARTTRRDSALALPPEEESRRSPSPAIPPNTPQ